jgi:hypothetical protein
VASFASALSVASGCPPRELRVVIASLGSAAAECATGSGPVDSCGPTVDATRFVSQTDEELRVRDGACIAARLAFVARPSEPDGPWPKNRRKRSLCVELDRDVPLPTALADAVDRSLTGGLTVEDVESAEDAVFVLGLFGSESAECDCGEESTLFACSRLSADTDDSSSFGVACTQCSGRPATDNDFATCSEFADQRCFFEGCLEVFGSP